jgi:hypothetical protein
MRQTIGDADCDNADCDNADCDNADCDEAGPGFARGLADAGGGLVRAVGDAVLAVPGNRRPAPRRPGRRGSEPDTESAL